MSQLENGFLVIDKPEGLTSHEVVQAIRRHLELRKVGHLGTLDPMATGVLPLAIGKATRLAQFLKGGPKIYQGTIYLGFSTNTFDRQGEATSTPVAPVFTLERLQEVRLQMLGEQLQVPPPFSAKKVGGVRSYHLARQGLVVTLLPQRIRIDRLDLSRRQENEIDFEIHCSAGTYIRSVAHELGLKLGCGAHLSRLRRLAAGEFHLDRGISLKTCMTSSRSDLTSRFISMNRVLQDLPELSVDSEIQNCLAHGRDFAAVVSHLPTPKTLFRVVSHLDELLGLAEALPVQSTSQAMDSSLAYFHPKVVL